MKAFVYVSWKDEIPDASGKLVVEKLNSQGFHEVLGCKLGRLIELEFDGSAGLEVQRRLESMCNLLLTDPDIERYEIIKIEDK